MKKSSNIVAGFVAAALALAIGAGCGGKSDQPSKLIGSWTAASGSLTGTCPVFGMFTQDLTGGAFTIEKGTMSDLLLTFNGCPVKFDLEGHSTSATSATAQAGQMCTFNVPPLGSVSVSITSWALQLTDDQTLTMTVSGSALGATCPVSGSATAIRSAVDAGAGG